MYFNQQGYGKAHGLEMLQQDNYLFLFYICARSYRDFQVFHTCIILVRFGYEVNIELLQY